MSSSLSHQSRSTLESSSSFSSASSIVGRRRRSTNQGCENALDLIRRPLSSSGSSTQMNQGIKVKSKRSSSSLLNSLSTSSPSSSSLLHSSAPWSSSFIVNRRVASVMLLGLGLIAMASLVSANSWGTAYQTESKRKTDGGEMQLETLLSEGEENCVRKHCVHSDQCCPGSVCVDLESSVLGTCMPIYGISEGESCLTDDDCESGLRCMEANFQYKAAAAAAASAAANQAPMDQAQSSLLSSSPLFAIQKPATMKTCQPPGRDMKKKQYNDECYTSDECDSSRGLCCQLIRRHRMAPRKLCYYFSDPKACIGQVDVSHAKPIHVLPNNAFFKARIG